MTPSAGDKVHKCTESDCTLTFKRPNLLELHKRVAHKGERPFSCESCGAAYSRKQALVRHQRRVHADQEDKPFACTICGGSYDCRANLVRHERKVHGLTDDVQLQNEVVDRPKTDSESDDTATGKKYTCKTCVLDFGAFRGLKRHNKKHHPENLRLPAAPIVAAAPKSYLCRACGLQFHKKSQRNLHQHKEHRMAAKLTYPCVHPSCAGKKAFRSKAHLDRHLKVHEGYSCEHCQTVLPNHQALRKHCEVEHPKEYRCIHCDKVYLSKFHLRRHRRVCLSDETFAFPCSFAKCGRSYRYKKNLDSHIASYHLGQRFRCAVVGCEWSLSTKQKLEAHLQLHSSGAEIAAPRTPKPPNETETEEEPETDNSLNDYMRGEEEKARSKTKENESEETKTGADIVYHRDYLLKVLPTKGRRKEKY